MSSPNGMPEGQAANENDVQQEQGRGEEPINIACLQIKLLASATSTTRKRMINGGYSHRKLLCQPLIGPHSCHRCRFARGLWPAATKEVIGHTKAFSCRRLGQKLYHSIVCCARYHHNCCGDVTMGSAPCNSPKMVRTRGKLLSTQEGVDTSLTNGEEGGQDAEDQLRQVKLVILFKGAQAPRK